ncbi:HupE/UreJ family protein [Mesorhizobium sp. M1E.F.Ca.ET.063.01.1.1]|uniref:HupE/UreJ family protein n=1 Tax=Mesorhizobium sp. M1E.F.Ca.ET.063.01.1.1 TaxID=2496750 RepID=UPI000FCBF92C|nr:HupE/UreJ family protein [Mesorhizobium sp. M1E.F.Ca.ET.063.01.1.1]RUW86136.1 HupE/UreJ family protein [Mesorhizobium sp. M1E.F.Ca.ET.063.01.1.1]
MSTTKRAILSTIALAGAVLPAQAHVGAGLTSSFSAGFGHPLSGLDHVTVMIAVGLWAAQKGGRAIWAWPAAFVAVMLVGAGFGMAQVPVPFVEPAILASTVALGLMVALAVDLPVPAGVATIAAFGFFHGHAHGTEVIAGTGGLEFMAGFGVSTALLHGLGIAAAFALGSRLHGLVRGAGAACVALGAGLAIGMI